MTRKEFYGLFRQVRITSNDIDINYKLNGVTMRGFIMDCASETRCYPYEMNVVHNNVPSMFNKRAIEFADDTMFYNSMRGNDATIIAIRKKRIQRKFAHK